MRACISLDGTRIAAAFADKTLFIYDTTTGEAILPPFRVDDNPRSVVFSNDGKLVASGGQALRLWNVETGEEVGSFDINVFSLAFSPDDTCIVAGCEGRKLFDCFVWDGAYNIRVINLERAKISYFHANVFVPSGGRAISLLKGEFWPSPFKGHEKDVLSVAYSADGKQIASGSSDGTVRVWDVSTGSRRSFTAHFERTVAFSPDGTQITANRKLISLVTGTCNGDAFGKAGLGVYSLAFSADGRFLACGSFKAACLHSEASTHQTIVQLVGHTGDVLSVAFFRNGKQIMSASKDGTIRVWDIEFKLFEEGEEMNGWQMDWGGKGYWILGPEKERLFWTTVPFQHARNTLVIGECSKIDFSNFVHGDEWVKCREPL